MLRLDLRTGQLRSIRPRAAVDPRRARGGPGGGGGFGGGNALTSNIVPAPPVGEQYRFNWSTPILLSPHNPRVVYVGGNKLFKSLDRGDTWTATIDLTKAIDRTKLAIMDVPGDKPMTSKHDGVTAFSTITVVAESPVVPGILWVGTDDGNVQTSKDGGATWTNVTKNIPPLVDNNYQVSRVEASHFDAATCYVTVDGHRSNDHKPYVFVTRDSGATWESLAANLPAVGNVNVIREDAKNKSLLFVGTEYGLFVSLDGGKEWKKFMTGLPTVRIDDLLIHPRDNDLIVGTHGRGIWICDDISSLQQMNEKALAADMHLFDIRPGTAWNNDVTMSRATGGQKLFRGENAPAGTALSYYLKAAPAGDVKITIADITGKVVRTVTATKEAGLNRVQWNLRGDAPAGGRGGRFGGGGAPPAAGTPSTTPPAASGQPAAPDPQQQQMMQQMMALRFGGNFGPSLEPGTYLVRLTVDGKDLTTKVVVEADK